MAHVANGTTVTFGTAVSGMTDISYSVNGNPVDLTTLSAARHEYGIGIPDIEVSITAFGVWVQNYTPNTLLISWGDGSTPTSLANMMLTAADTGGSVDSALTSKLTFKPAAT